MFVDSAKIFIKSGKGGDGHVSFRRELYVPAGGPDGGNGGRGGDIIFEVDTGLNTLGEFRSVRRFIAEDGEEGRSKRRSGKDGKDLVIRVPEGTVIREAETGKVVTDMSGDNRREIVLKGGRGGTGNMNYATPTMQAPLYAKPGRPGRELHVLLELKVIADVGLLGYPNVGKSTFLAATTNARPKIADYAFTTITPNLGVVDLPGGAGFVMADIPGLIDGAAEGVGLGHDFLKHVERTRLLLHLVDASGFEGRDPVEDIENINGELAKYSAALAELPQILVANKIDAVDPESDNPARLRAYAEAHQMPYFEISAVSGEGVKPLLYKASEMLQQIGKKPLVFEREFSFEDLSGGDLPYTVAYDEKEEEYVVEGPAIEKMLGYTNLMSEKGFLFFQKFLRERGILDELKALGLQEGDTVRLYGHVFEFYEDEEQ
ncbi:MAG: GTPase ObgE [Lachnospiraceae bacterium]|nr:GTPase ObgE [Lachnospiraceae bacterium]